MILLFFIVLVHKTFAQQTDSLVLGNAVLYYYSYGQGIPILVLSGGPGISSHGEDDLATHLSKKYQVILFEQRGTGKSWTKPFDSTTINLKQAVEDIELLRKHLNIDKLNIAGHSWGSMLASAYTATYPNHVNLLLLIGSGEIDVDITQDVNNNIIRHMQPSDLAVFKFWGDSANAKKDPEQAAYMLRKYWVKQLVFDTSQLDNVMNGVKDGKMNNTMANLMWHNLINTKMNLTNELSKYSGSALVVFGWEDPVGVTALSQYMKAFPHAQFEGIHNCGHYCAIEQPILFYSVINTFLEKHLH